MERCSRPLDPQGLCIPCKTYYTNDGSNTEDHTQLWCVWQDSNPHVSISFLLVRSQAAYRRNNLFYRRTVMWYSRRDSNPYTQCLRLIRLPITSQEHIGTLGWIRTYNQLILSQPALPISVQGQDILVFLERFELSTLTFST